MAGPTAALAALRDFILAQRAAAAVAPEVKMLQGVYRGFAGENASPVIHYHGGTYPPGAMTERPLYMSRDKAMAQGYADIKGGRVVALAPRPRKTATPRELKKLAAKYVPENAANYYTPATALDVELHGETSVGDLVNELWNREYDSARAFDVGMNAGRGGTEGEVLVALPGENIQAAPTERIFISPQKRIADYYAQKRAAQTGEAPHAEMLLVDPFGGESYGHSTMGTGREPPMFTKARKIKPEDVVESTQLYQRGGAVHMDEGGAAFGVFPQMKARRAQQDRTAAANAPLSALRGWAAGTAGLPGDIEGLARAGISQLPPQLLTAFPALRAFGIGSRADPTPQLPTTEFYNEYLPGAQLNATPTGKAFTTAGNLFGGAGSTTLARYGIKSAKATAKAIAEAAPGPVSGSRAAQLGVIKMPGGNWLKHSVEDAVSPMKRHQNPDEALQLYASSAANPATTPETLAQLNQHLPGWQRESALNNFIDKKIAPYIRNEMATPDDPLRAMAEKYAVDKPVKLAEVQARIDAFAAKMEQTARERGVPVGDLTSMRQQMIGLEKEKALVEAREGLHVDLQQLNFRPEVHGEYLQPGQTAVAQSLPAKAWEGASDLKIISMPASERLNTTISLSQKNLDENPWLAKVPPETTVHTIAEPRRLSSDLGFDHLVDELRNAINPASGLPKNLLIDPADLGKLTMPQAVDRVADINAWRATQRIEANQAIANNAATQVVKEYPEQGLKWVELKTGSEPTTLPAGYSIKPTDKPEWLALYGPDGRSTGAVGKTAEEVMINQEFSKKALEDALKYEGDTLQHCVGGYCQDVVEGKSRIYSLRDSKGQPRVTIEVEPDDLPKKFSDLWDVAMKHVSEESPGWEHLSEYGDPYTALKEHYGSYVEDPRYVIEGILEHFPEALDATLADINNLSPKITQIKGFRNKKPADEYLPMVQDFVKSGKWSRVDDLQNTGLVDLQQFPKRMEALGGRYVLESDLNNYLESMPGERFQPPEGMAQGGLVSNHFDPIKIKQIIASLDDEYDPERIQQIVAQRESAYA